MLRLFGVLLIRAAGVSLTRFGVPLSRSAATLHWVPASAPRNAGSAALVSGPWVIHVKKCSATTDAAFEPDAVRLARKHAVSGTREPSQLSRRIRNTPPGPVPAISPQSPRSSAPPVTT